MAPMAPHGGSPYPAPVPSPAPMPMPMPMPMPAVGGGPGHESHPFPRTGTGSRNLVLAVIGLVVVGGAVAIFAAPRGGKGGAATSDPGATPAPSGSDDQPDDDTETDDESETDVPPVPSPATDFSITPERPLYDPSPTTQPTPGGALEKDAFDDGIWKGGWWKDPNGLFRLDVPAGFSQTSALGDATQFAGSCGPVPCTIVAVAFPTPGQTIDVVQVKQVVGQLPIGTGAQPTNVRKQKLGGRRCVLLEFKNPDSGFAGEMALCPSAGTVPAVAVQTFPNDFAASKKFRSEFFARRIKF